ncbi:MAG: trypsin-like peptidase domain-containing protein [Nitrospinae bacterium]|nr:trypsin-like peptidase domain-containing protein [Nitrospinota bacterium]
MISSRSTTSLVRSALASACLILALVMPGISRAQSAGEWYQQAFEFSLKGDADKAIEAYRRAIELQPDWAEAHHGLATLYFEAKSGVQAIAHLRKAEALYGRRADDKAKKNLAIARKNLDKAYRLLNLGPEDFDALTPSPPEIQWQATGTGFLIGPAGYLLTSLHAVKDADRIRVRFPRDKVVSAEIVRSFVVYDAALLKLKDASAVPPRVLSFGDSSRLRPGDPVYAVDPARSGTPPYRGSLQTVNAVEDNDSIFAIVLPWERDPGGAPVFNESGEVVGMAFSKAFMEKNFSALEAEKAGTDFALKASYLAGVLPEISGPDRKTRKPGEEPRPADPAKNTGTFLEDAWQNLVSIETLPKEGPGK